MSTPPPPPRRQPIRVSDLRGAARLAVQGVQGVTHIAQGLHGSISRVALPLGSKPVQPAGGIAGFVYGAVRATSGIVGTSLDAALAAAQALLRTDVQGAEASPARNAIVSALNGVMGDHLERTANPLAIPMALVPAGAEGPHLLILVHGLCMNDEQWLRDGHDHGAALAADLRLTPIYLRYNTGRHIHDNGADFARLLEERIAASPVAVQSVAIVGHSMGGLVARSAVQSAQRGAMAWPALVRSMVFLGTPHHGAPLERAGNWLHRAFGISPYIAPFARISGLRSAGITDLRHGNVLATDQAGDRFAARDGYAHLPLPRGIKCHAIAGTVGTARAGGLLGDGLVTVESALGHHAKPTRSLRIPKSRTWVAHGVNHMDLLSSPAVYQRLKLWLAGPAPAARARQSRQDADHGT